MDLIEEINLSNLFTITSLLLGIMAFVITIGIIGGASQEYYDYRVGGVMYFLLVTMSACLLLPNFGRKKATYLAAGSLIVGLLFVLLSPFNNIFIDATLPVVVISAIASISEIYRSLSTKNLLQKIKSTSPHIIHLGIVVLIIGILLSSVYIAKDSHTFSQQGENWEWQGYNFEYNGYKPKNIGYGQTYNFNFDIYKDGEFLDQITITGVNKTGTTSWRPGLHSGLTEDVYISLRSSTSTGVSINAQVAPFMSLLWVGIALLSIGITLRVSVPVIEKKEKVKRKRDTEIEKEKVDDIDDKIEEELRKFREEKDK